MSDNTANMGAYGGRQNVSGDLIVGPMGSRETLMQTTTVIPSTTAVGDTITTLVDPFAGLGLGTTTFVTVGQGSPALTLAGSAVKLNANPTYRKNFITVEATAGDGKTRVSQTIQLNAATVTSGSGGGGGGGGGGGSIAPTLTLSPLSSTPGNTWSATIGGRTAGTILFAIASDGTPLTVDSGAGTVSGRFLASGSPTVTVHEFFPAMTGVHGSAQFTVTVAANAFDPSQMTIKPIRAWDSRSGVTSSAGAVSAVAGAWGTTQALAAQASPAAIVTTLSGV